MAISTYAQEFPSTLELLFSNIQKREAMGHSIISTEHPVNGVLSEIHPCLIEFPLLCILDVSIVDYNSPKIDDAYALIHIEPEMQEKLQKLLKLCGMKFIDSTPEYVSSGKYLLAVGRYQCNLLSSYLQNRFSKFSSPIEPIIIVVDTSESNWIFKHQPKNSVMEIDLAGITDWINFSMISEGISNIRSAISFGNRKFPVVKYSRISQASRFLENGTIKFDGYLEGEDSLQILHNEFPYLHDAVLYMQKHPELEENSDKWKRFKKFLSALASIIESEHVFLPTRQMIEADEDWKIDHDLWHKLRSFMESCCDFILCDAHKIEVPKILHSRDKTAEISLNGNVEEISQAASSLQTTMSKSFNLQNSNHGE